MAHLVFHNTNGWYNIQTNISYDEEYLCCLESGIQCITGTNPVGVLSGYNTSGMTTPPIVGDYYPLG